MFSLVLKAFYLFVQLNNPFLPGKVFWSKGLFVAHCVLGTAKEKLACPFIRGTSHAQPLRRRALPVALLLLCFLIVDGVVLEHISDNWTVDEFMQRT